ncbi:hypothetical protein B0H17DRAFT_921713, partial [Mycena rosella]
RLFAIIVSVGWNLIWNLRVLRVVSNPDCIITKENIYNHWLRKINEAFQRDRILTYRNKFGPFALKKQLVLNTWSGLLMDEDSLPEDWTCTEGVLVGMRPINEKKNSIG